MATPFPVRDALGFCVGSPMGMGAYGGLMALGGFALGRAYVPIHQLPPVMDAYGPEILAAHPAMEPMVETLRAAPQPWRLDLMEDMVAQAETAAGGRNVSLEPLSAEAVAKLRALPSVLSLGLFPAEEATDPTSPPATDSAASDVPANPEQTA